LIRSDEGLTLETSAFNLFTGPIYLINSVDSITAVTIPENLPLSDSKRSVLSEGLHFVPIAKRSDEFSVKQDVEKFLRLVQLKAFFHDQDDNSITSDKRCF